jgi:hypothetical protein
MTPRIGETSHMIRERALIGARRVGHGHGLANCKDY